MLRCTIARHQPILAGVDSEARNPLDRAYGRRDSFRHRLSLGLHGSAQLHSGCVRDLLSERYGSCVMLTKHVSSSIAVRHRPDV